MGIYKLSFKNFKRRKLRSALTMLGIIIGVVALVVLMGIGSGMTAYMKDQTEFIGGNIIVMNGSGGSGLVQSSTELLNSKAVSQIENMSQLYDIKKETKFTVEFNGVQTYIIGLSDWNLLKKINGTPGVVTSKMLADKFGYKIGSKIKIKDQEMTVTGIVNEGTMGMAMVAIDVNKALPMIDNKVTSITASTKGDPDIVKKEIEAQVKGTTALTKSDFSKQVDNVMNGITVFIGAIAGIALLVGIISIVNIMIVNVTERTKELGVLKAIGFTNREVMGSILIESGLLGFIGAVFGLIIATIMLQLGIVFFAPQLGMDGLNITRMLPVWLVGGVLGGSAILSVLAGLYPAWRASKLNIVEALRYE